MSASWSTCAASMNGCPARANPKRKNLRQPSSWHRCSWHAARAMRRHYLPRGTFRLVSKNFKAASPIWAWILRRSTPGASMQACGNSFLPVVVTFVAEDVVIDAAGNDVELGVGDVARGELGVVLGRRLVSP